MKDLYLKEIELNDLDLYTEYYNDFKRHFPSRNFDISKDAFEQWYNTFNKTRESKNSMHIFPFWLIKDGKAIGLPIIKTNIENNDEYNKYGGHISYVIAPSYRKKGYGTICCHLAIKKCREYGLKEVMISVDDRNIESISIIEKNYGILNDVCIHNGEEQSFVGRFFRRYIVGVEDSLKKYEQQDIVVKSTLKQICNLNRQNLNDFLINNMQSKVGENTLTFSKHFGKIDDIKDFANFYKTFIKNFIIDENSKFDKVARLTEEIVKSQICSGSNDVGLVLSTILRLKNIPTIFVSSAHIDWIKSLQEGKHKSEIAKYHVFLEIYLNNKWHLFEPMNGKIYENYDYNNLSLPNGYYAFRKTLNNCNFGAYTSEDNNRILCEAFISFDLNEYKDPYYKFIDLKKVDTFKDV